MKPKWTLLKPAPVEKVWGQLLGYAIGILGSLYLIISPQFPVLMWKVPGNSELQHHRGTLVVRGAVEGAYYLTESSNSKISIYCNIQLVSNNCMQPGIYPDVYLSVFSVSGANGPKQVIASVAQNGRYIVDQSNQFKRIQNSTLLAPGRGEPTVVGPVFGVPIWVVVTSIPAIFAVLLIRSVLSGLISQNNTIE